MSIDHSLILASEREYAVVASVPLKDSYIARNQRGGMQREKTVGTVSQRRISIAITGKSSTANNRPQISTACTTGDSTRNQRSGSKQIAIPSMASTISAEATPAAETATPCATNT